MAGATRIAELANIIATQTKVVDDYLQSHNFSTPSFGSDGPKTLPIPASETEITRARYQVITCTEELNELMKGPTEVLWTRFVSTSVFYVARINDSHHLYTALINGGFIGNPFRSALRHCENPP